MLGGARTEECHLGFASANNVKFRVFQVASARRSRCGQLLHLEVI